MSVNANAGDVLAGIAAAMRAGQFPQASAMADAALTRGLVHPLLYQARAIHLDKLGKGEEALMNFRKAQSLNPADPMIANGVALCLGRMGRLDEAMAAFEIALRLDPNLVTTHFHMGWILEMHENFEAAAEAYRRAIERAPQYGAALSGLATTAEGLQDWAQVETAAGRALALDSNQPRIILALAHAEIECSKFGAAEARLRAALHNSGRMPLPLKIGMMGFLADALDAQDKIREAFDAYTATNNEKLKVYIASRPAFDMSALVRELTEHFRRTYPDDWTMSSPQDGPRKPREHVFLVGFPRSGTTLLEQVFAAHPDVVTLEESDVLDGIAEKFLRDLPGLDRLARLSGAALEHAREQYWHRVRGHGLAVDGKVLVDKLPLNTIKLPLIARLFPGAKVVFALRDPRDVVFSCFRRPFQTNASTCEFLSLPGCARFYNSVMTLGELCRERLPLPTHIYRHEDLVADFETETRRLCVFLGIDWSERLGDFALVAQQRKINSISAAQVRRGLNGDGNGQWRRYSSQLQGILPLLQPWIAKFGYEPG